ncbi:MAG: ATP-dependent sacrificial sulfur transferase LarE [Alphaproteobacteria bacterium]|nr:ATP-dependent sacrificial sulfur transferase LarE [Alphaproteobacteria bacterium]
MDTLHQKQEKLKQYLKNLGSIAVAFSSGVDSTFLLKTAHDVLGNNAIAITVVSSFFPRRELNETVAFCRKENIKAVFVQSDVLNIGEIQKNPKNRCYLCKSELFKKILQTAKENGIENVAEGSNIDDLSDYRPGLQAIDELGIKSPLRAAEMSKTEIRLLSKEMGLPTWNKPSFACLASRFMYGETISEEKLKMVDQAEQFLLNLGFHQLRVRIHGKMARIELNPEEFENLIAENIRKKVVSEFKKFGFSYISMDLIGYRTGSMNETLF